MITELHNLKVRAIAVEIAPQYDIHYVLDGKLKLGLEHISTWKQEIDLPEGKWSILGRCQTILQQAALVNELYNSNSRAETMNNFGKWSDYMASNNLTNQLILIEQI